MVYTLPVRFDGQGRINTNKGIPGPLLAADNAFQQEDRLLPEFQYGAYRCFGVAEDIFYTAV